MIWTIKTMAATSFRAERNENEWALCQNKHRSAHKIKAVSKLQSCCAFILGRIVDWSPFYWFFTKNRVQIDPIWRKYDENRGEETQNPWRIRRTATSGLHSNAAFLAVRACPLYIIFPLALAILVFTAHSRRRFAVVSFASTFSLHVL